MGKLFDRQIEVIISGYKFSSNEFEIDFKVDMDSSSEPNKAEINIFNLKDSSTKRFVKDDGIVLNAGYLGDVGTIFAGDIESASSDWSGVDRITKVLALDGMSAWVNKTVNKTYKAGIKSSQVVKDVLGTFGLEVGKLKLSKDITYKNGKTVSGSIQSVLRQIVIKECDSKFYIQNGAVIIMPHGEGLVTVFVLNSDTGLVGSPQYFERDDNDKGLIKGYNVTSLLNHQIRIDSIIKLDSRAVKGLYRVIKCTHDGKDFNSKMEVISV